MVDTFIMSPFKRLTAVKFLYFLIFIGLLLQYWEFAWHLIRYQEIKQPQVPRRLDCTLNTCFDPKCFSFDSSTTPKNSLILTRRVHIYPEINSLQRLLDAKASPIYQSMLNTVRKSRFYTENAEKACIFLSPFSSMCRTNDCDPTEAFMQFALNRLPHWNGGRNHLLFDLSDYNKLPYDSEHAIIARSSFILQEFRNDFDVPIPLLPENRHILPLLNNGTYSTNPTSTRKYLAFFKGGLSEVKADRIHLASIHDGTNVIIALQCSPSYHPSCLDWNKISEEYDFVQTMNSTKFSIVFKGMGLHSYRFLESIVFGAVPVVVADDWLFPYEHTGLIQDWSCCSIRIAEKNIKNIPSILSRYTDQQIDALRENGARLVQQYFPGGYDRVALLTLEIIERRLAKNFYGFSKFTNSS